MKKLNDTIELMDSPIYRDRFAAEYWQLVIRYNNLKSMLNRWDRGDLEYEPVCPRSTYDMQIKTMVDYIAILEARAVMEKIKL